MGNVYREYSMVEIFMISLKITMGGGGGIAFYSYNYVSQIFHQKSSF